MSNFYYGKRFGTKYITIQFNNEIVTHILYHLSPTSINELFLYRPVMAAAALEELYNEKNN